MFELDHQTLERLATSNAFDLGDAGRMLLTARAIILAKAASTEPASEGPRG